MGVIRIGLDAQGGDSIFNKGAKINVAERAFRSALRFLENHEDAIVYIAGHEKDLAELVRHNKHPRLHAEFCTARIESDGSITGGTRRETPLYYLIRQLAPEEGSGIISGVYTSANTKAAATLSYHYVKPIEGIKLPPMMAEMASKKEGKSWFALDMGAWPECSPENLLQYAILGSIYAQNVRKIPNPAVGLISNGNEGNKGNHTIREAQRKIEEYLSEFKNFDFVGQIEAEACLSGEIDVAVVDGFVGNIALKFLEQGVSALGKVIRQKIESQGVMGKLGALLLSPSLARAKAHLSVDKYNGAIFLGLREPVVKGHGTATEDGFFYGLERTMDYARAQVPQRIRKEIQYLSFQD